MRDILKHNFSLGSFEIKTDLKQENKIAIFPTTTIKSLDDELKGTIYRGKELNFLFWDLSFQLKVLY